MKRLLAIGFVPLALAGCGNSNRLSHRQYQAKLDALNQLAWAVAIDARGPGRAIGAERFLFLTSRWKSFEERVATTLGNLTPPKDAEHGNLRLTRAARELARETDAALRLASRSRDGVLLSGRESGAIVERGTARASHDFELAAEELRQAGYRFN